MLSVPLSVRDDEGSLPNLPLIISLTADSERSRRFSDFRRLYPVCCLFVTSSAFRRPKGAGGKKRSRKKEKEQEEKLLETSRGYITNQITRGLGALGAFCVSVARDAASSVSELYAHSPASGGSSASLWDQQQRQNIKLGTCNLDSVPLAVQKDGFRLLSKHQHVAEFRNEALWSWEGALAADSGGCGGERAWPVPVSRVLPLKLEAGRFTSRVFAPIIKHN